MPKTFLFQLMFISTLILKDKEICPFFYFLFFFLFVFLSFAVSSITLKLPGQIAVSVPNSFPLF